MVAAANSCLTIALAQAIKRLKMQLKASKANDLSFLTDTLPDNV